MEECIFCKIVNGEIPSSLLYDTEQVIAFEDINPQAPVHVLVVPKRHIPTIMDLSGDEGNLMKELFLAVQEVARIKGVSESGFRTVINCNSDGGQLVFHLHVHVLGGRALDGLMG